MKAYKCDMCREYFDFDDPAVTIVHRGGEMVMMSGDRIKSSKGVSHLCDECWKKIAAFIKGEVK